MGGSGRLSQNPSKGVCDGSVGDVVGDGDDDNDVDVDVDDDDDDDDDDDMDVDDMRLVMDKENFSFPH